MAPRRGQCPAWVVAHRDRNGVDLGTRLRARNGLGIAGDEVLIVEPDVASAAIGLIDLC